MKMQNCMNFAAVIAFACLQLSQSVPAQLKLHQPARKSQDLLLHHVVTDCVSVTSEEGLFEISSTNQDTPCGLYILSDPDYVVEVSLRHMSISCKGGLISVIDGWEMNNEFFPSEKEHELPLEKRYKELCGEHGRQHILTSHQNAALIMYQLPQPTDKFTVMVRFRKNPAPCNILTEGASFFTLRNYGARRNCSLVAMYPATFDVVMLNVGEEPKSPSGAKRTNGIHRESARDAVQIGGASGMDTSAMQIADELTGEDSNPRGLEYGIGCGVSSVKLVSSGSVDNTVTVAVNMLDLTDPQVFTKISVLCVP